MTNLPKIVQCSAIGHAAVVVNYDTNTLTKLYTVCARKGRSRASTWMMGPTRKSERAAIEAWNSWIAKLRFGEWRPA
jgi:poly(3-hydroxyalkanoate) synthetase